MRAIRATTSSICGESTDVGDRHGVSRRRLDPTPARGAFGRRGAVPAAAAHGARFVQHVDGAVGQPVVAQVPRGQLAPPPRARRPCTSRCGAPRSASAGPAGSARSPGSSARRSATFCRRRASARSFSMCLYSSSVVEPTTRSSPVGQDRLDQRREVHRAAGGGAGADGRVHLVDEEDRLRPLGERVDDRLEALLEVAAEARAGEQRGGVEREDLRALQHFGDVVLQQPRARALRRARSCRRRRRRRTRDCSCGGGRGSRASAAARACGRSADRARRPRRALGQIHARRRRADRARSRPPRSPAPASASPGAASASRRAAGGAAAPC